MAVKGSGTKAATVDVWTSLGAFVPVAGGEPMQLRTDISALTGAEKLAIKIETKTLATSTQGITHDESFNAQQALKTPVITLPAMLFDQPVEFFIKQIGGISRTFDWSVLS